VDFRAAIDGMPDDINTKQLNGGARIRHIFHEIFATTLDEIQPTTGLTLNDIRTAIRNAAGPKPALFVPDAAFELLSKRQIEMLKEPAITCAEMVYNELLRIVAELENKDMKRFLNLRDRVMEVATDMLRKLLSPTNEMIETLIKLELSYINTNHPDFVGTNVLLNQSREDIEQADISKDLEPSPEDGQRGIFRYLFGRKESKRRLPMNDPREEGKPGRSGIQDEPPAVLKLDERNITERERMQIKLIKALLDSYFKIVRKTVLDNVTKAVMMLLVNNAKDNLQRELVTNLYKEELYSSLLQESPDITTKRAIITEELAALRKAKKVLHVSELVELTPH